MAAICTKTHLQGPELGHVVEAGHGQSADVVVVERADGGRRGETTQTDS